MARIFETYELPSNGCIAGAPKEVVIQNMTTRDEKILLASQDGMFDRLIKACIKEPEDIDMKNLIVADQQFLLMKLRALSYGNIYPFSYTCPHCGKTSEYEIDLNELPVTYLPEGFKEPYATFKLPQSGDSVSLRIPRVGETERVRVKTRRFNKQFPQAVGDISYIYSLMLHFYSINDMLCNSADVPVNQRMSETDLQAYVEDLSVMDSSMIKNQVDKLEVGINNTIYEECPNCHEDVEFNVTVGGEFFRSRVGL